jgi:glucose/arabinose dehydrogenase
MYASHLVQKAAGRCSAVACLPLLGAILAAEPPQGFHKTTVASNLNQPTAIAFGPDGRLFVAERTGRVLRVHDRVTTEVLHLSDTNFSYGESGLLGLTIDPAFPDEPWLYVFYTRKSQGPPASRVSRFRASGDVFDALSEEVLWEVTWTQGIGHFAGGLAFGPDGNLYISTGDNWQPESSQDLARPEGKILRIRPDGSIPPDNPYVASPRARADVWAYGFRNPFRFAFDSHAGDLYVGDVGATAWEEVDRVRPGDNGGWPWMEGPKCYVPDCGAYLPPIWSYPHDDEFEGAASITMGPVYRGTAFPPEYEGNIFVAEYIRGFILRLVLNEDGEVIDAPVFDADEPAVVDMKIGPDGALYTLRFWGHPGGVQRIAFFGSNEAPVALASADPLRGDPPLAVQFAGHESFDPDDWPQPLTHRWDFGDGAQSAEPDPLHVYEHRGQYKATLIVSDGEIETAAESITINVGGPPMVSIAVPEEGARFRSGEKIEYEAIGMDAEDGVLPETAFEWNVYIVRPGGAVNLLTGPFAGQRKGAFTVPTSGRDLEESHLRLHVRVMDSDGAAAEAERDIWPVVSALFIDSNPSGVPVFLDELPRPTPYVHLGPAGYEHVLRAQTRFVIDGELYEFVGWRGYGGESLSFAAREGESVFVADYRRREAEPQQARELNDAEVPAGCFPCAVPFAIVAGAGLVALRRTRR